VYLLTLGAEIYERESDVRRGVVFQIALLVAILGCSQEAAADQARSLLAARAWIFKSKTITHGDDSGTSGSPCLEHRLTFSFPDTLTVACGEGQIQQVHWRQLTDTASGDVVLEFWGGAFANGRQFDANLRYSDGHLFLTEHRLGRLEYKRVYVYIHER
jgi:hypothetical protein